MELQERDFKVLGMIERWGVVGLGQVDGALFRKYAEPPERTRLFFNEMTREDYWGRAYKRLSGLEKLGLIRVQRPAHTWPVYLLTVKGHELLKRRGTAIFQRPVLKISDLSVQHEVAVVGVGLCFYEFLGRPVDTARQIWHRIRTKYPDGRDSRASMPDLLVQMDGFYHLVEVELTPKYKERYNDIFRSHSRALHQQGRILYLTGWPSGPEFIKRATEASEWGFPVNVATLAEFRENSGGCAFVACRRNEPDIRFKPTWERSAWAPRTKEEIRREIEEDYARERAAQQRDAAEPMTAGAQPGRC